MGPAGTSEEGVPPVTAPCASFEQDWIIALLADSNCPTGSFHASCGLEAAVAIGLIQPDRAGSLEAFTQAAAHSSLASTLPYVRRVWALATRRRSPPPEPTSPPDPRSHAHGTGSEPRSWLESFHAWDSAYDAIICSNPIARAASKAQGLSLLSLMIRSFPSEAAYFQLPEIKRRLQRPGPDPGHVHYPIVYGLVCGMFGIAWSRCVALQLHLHLRQMLSAAVRLNVVGPFQSTTLLYQLRLPAAQLVQEQVARWEGDADYAYGEEEGEEDAIALASHQTSPLADLAQSLHGQLYSRLFQS